MSEDWEGVSSDRSTATKLTYWVCFPTGWIATDKKAEFTNMARRKDALQAEERAVTYEKGTGKVIGLEIRKFKAGKK